jgi:hypothetical protein
MSDFIATVFTFVGAGVAVVLICWVINELAAMELNELREFKAKHEKEDK